MLTNISYKRTDDISNLDAQELARQCISICEHGGEDGCIRGASIGTGTGISSNPQLLWATVDTEHPECTRDHSQEIQELLESFNIRIKSEKEKFLEEWAAIADFPVDKKLTYLATRIEGLLK